MHLFPRKTLQDVYMEIFLYSVNDNCFDLIHPL